MGALRGGGLDVNVDWEVDGYFLLKLKVVSGSTVLLITTNPL